MKWSISQTTDYSQNPYPESSLSISLPQIENLVKCMKILASAEEMQESDFRLKQCTVMRFQHLQSRQA